MILFARKCQVVVSVSFCTALVVFYLPGQQKINQWKKPIAQGLHLPDIDLYLYQKTWKIWKWKQIENHYCNVTPLIPNKWMLPDPRTTTHHQNVNQNIPLVVLILSRTLWRGHQQHSTARTGSIPWSFFISNRNKLKKSCRCMFVWLSDVLKHTWNTEVFWVEEVA